VTVILSSLQIDLESSISARFGMGATAVAVGGLFALIAGQIELGLCLFSLLGGAGGYVIYKSRQSYQMVFNSYYEVLDLAIEEVLKWTTTVTGSYTAKMSKRKNSRCSVGYINLTTILSKTLHNLRGWAIFVPWVCTTILNLLFDSSSKRH
jgi:hypothetical protein